MRFIKSIVLLVFAVMGAQVALAQVVIENHDQVYGYDPLLYNGKLYTYFPIPGTEGTQYIDAEFNPYSAVILRGIRYTGIMLNYDVYNQLVVLKYYNDIGSANLIEISPAWLEAFELEDARFELLAIQDSTKRIYQVLGNEAAKILYYRHKELLVYTHASVGYRYFSDIAREKYVYTGNHLLKYKNNRSFVKCFSADKNEAIKKYLRQHKIRVNKANDTVITELINFCNTLN